METQFKNLERRLKAEARKELAEYNKTIKEVKSLVVEELPLYSLRECVTPGKKRKGFKTLTEFRTYLKQRVKKLVADRLQAKLDKLQRVSNAQDVESITITIEWKKNRTWGNCPRAEMDLKKVNFTRDYINVSTVTGCGYDKESTAFANAFNASASALKILYKEKNRPKNNTKKNGECLGYGSGYGLLPNLEGGVGVSCFYRIFEACGYKLENVASGKTFDVYKITKK